VDRAATLVCFRTQGLGVEHPTHKVNLAEHPTQSRRHYPRCLLCCVSVLLVSLLIHKIFTFASCIVIELIASSVHCQTGCNKKPGPAQSRAGRAALNSIPPQANPYLRNPYLRNPYLRILI